MVKCHCRVGYFCLDRDKGGGCKEEEEPVKDEAKSEASWVNSEEAQCFFSISQAWRPTEGVSRDEEHTPLHAFMAALGTKLFWGSSRGKRENRKKVAMRATAYSEKGDQVKGGCTNTDKLQISIKSDVQYQQIHFTQELFVHDPHCDVAVLTVMWLSGYYAVENVAVVQDSVSGKYDHLLF